MAENQEQAKTRTAPTEKMVAAAKNAAERHGVKLPKDFDKSYDVCKAFLDEYINKPSPKAIKFAEGIAKEKGLTVPAEALASGKELSAWIDANK